MKELTKRFRDLFKEFDYESNQISILLSMINLIIDMMHIVDNDEDRDKIVKLSSFLKILSTDFCKDVLDETMVELIYQHEVVPVLEHFEDYYSEKSASELVVSSEKMIEDAKQRKDNPEIRDYIDKSTARQANIVKIDDGDEYKLFKLLTNTSYKLKLLYEQQDMNKHRDELLSILNSSKITMLHSNKLISTLSSLIWNISSSFLSGYIDHIDRLIIDSYFECIQKIQNLKYSTYT